VLKQHVDSKWNMMIFCKSAQVMKTGNVLGSYWYKNIRGDKKQGSPKTVLSEKLASKINV
jgi:hypothetical protein